MSRVTVERAIAKVQPVVNRYIHMGIVYEISHAPKRGELNIFATHPHTNKRTHTVVNRDDSEEFIMRQLFGIVNKWGDLRECDHDCTETKYRGYMLVCPVCWRERQ